METFLVVRIVLMVLIIGEIDAARLLLNFALTVNYRCILVNYGVIISKLRVDYI